MAMNGNDMGDAVVTAIEGVDPSMTPDQIAQLRASWRAICSAIVTYMTANAAVVTSTPGAQAGGSTLPGTGTVS